MHEVSLMQRVIEIAEEAAHQNEATRIHRLGLKIGPLLGVVPEALEFAFDVVTRGTMAEAAKLEVEYLPLRADCLNCKHPFEPPGFDLSCPNCGSLQTQVQGGREMQLTTLEVS